MLPIILMAAMATSATNEYVSYSGYREPIIHLNSIKIDTVKKILWVGHAGRGMSVCAPTDRFYCFQSPPVSFAIPKYAIDVGDTWSLKGIGYTVKRIQKISVLGVSADCFVVASMQGKKEIEFFYSEDRGLVAMWFPSRKSADSNFFISVKEKGFPYTAVSAP
jgi:hypothetical protein